MSRIDVSGAFVRPYFVTRVAALPTRIVSELRVPAMETALDRMALLDAACAEERDAISEALHVVIGAAGDRGVRGRLLALRRALYRGDPTAGTLLEDATAALTPDVYSAVSQAMKRLEERRDAELTLRTAHAEALHSARGRFREALGAADFEKGLLLSSRALYANLARYRAGGGGRVTSRDQQIERGLLRYFARAVMKATPFARFCAITEGGMVGDDRTGPPLLFDADPSQKRGHVRLDKGLYAVLWAHLKTRPAVRRALAVELNPTVEPDGGRLRFLASVEGKEAFQRVAHNEAIQVVVAHARRRPGLTLGELGAALAAEPGVEATTDEAVQFLDALVGYGLLRFRSFVPEQLADWDEPLREALLRIDDEHAARIAATLAIVRSFANQYADGDAAERSALAGQIRATLEETFAELQLSGRLSRELPIFEDASTAARLSLHGGPGTDKAFALLAEWVALTQPLAYPHAEQATMRHFFDMHYAGAGAVPLLRFYEDFYREHLKAHLEKESRARRLPDDPSLHGYDLGNPFGLARVHALREAAMAVTELVRSRWATQPDAEVVTITPHEVRQAVEGSRGEEGAVCRSASAFCQLVPQGDSSAGMTVVLPDGSYHLGFGKYFSRFLYMLPESLRARISEDNAALAGDAVLAEICGDAHFNANLHPRLLPWEISYPTGDSAGEAGQISSATLGVTPDPDSPYALRIVDAAGRRVLPVDLGFLNARIRPPLYQLLMRFAPGGSFRAVLPETPTPRPGRPGTAPASDRGPDERVVHRPRVVFGGVLVLARRRWTVPGSLVPRQAAAEDDASFFLRVDRWRRTQGLPAEAYLRVIPQRQASAAAGASAAPNDAPYDAPHGAPHDAPIDAPIDAPSDACVVDDEEYDSPAEEEADVMRGAVGEAHDRPDEVASAGPVASVTPRRDRPSRDWHKPQYIDFTSPLFVRLFARIAGTLTAFRLHVEECYPGPEMLPAFDRERFVSELVVQIDLPAAAAPGGPVTRLFGVQADVAEPVFEPDPAVAGV